MKSFRYLIFGRVQGVAFRHYTVSEAEKLGVMGTVKNLANGDVEVLAQVDDDVIARFELFLHKGPRLARVDRIEKFEFDNSEKYRGFDIDW